MTQSVVFQWRVDFVCLVRLPGLERPPVRAKLLAGRVENEGTLGCVNDEDPVAVIPILVRRIFELFNGKYRVFAKVCIDFCRLRISKYFLTVVLCLTFHHILHMIRCCNRVDCAHIGEPRAP